MKRKELLGNIKLILPLLNQYNDGTIHAQISFLQGLECALENGDSLPTIREIKDILYPPRGGLSDFFVWKNDYLERLRINEEIETYNNRLWELLNQIEKLESK